jgi:hypothetical protein
MPIGGDEANWAAAKYRHFSTSKNYECPFRTKFMDSKVLLEEK